MHLRTIGPSLALVALVALAVAAAPAPATAMVPDGLEVTGWILQGGSNRLVERNADGITTLSVAAVALAPDGGGVTAPGRDHERLRKAAHRHGLAAELLVSNYSNRLGDFEPRRLHRLLANPKRIVRVARRLAGFAAQGWDGINIDLERVRARDGDGLVTLAEQLGARLPDEKTVSIDVSAATSRRAYRDRGYRLARLAAAVDVIDLMTYDLHGPTWSGPGPIGDLDWQRRALEALLAVVPPGQVQLGVAGYGYTWPREGTGRSVTVRQARRLVERSGATAHWRPGPGEWTARLPDGTRMWWSDGRSYRRRVALAREYGVRGLAVWRLGSADPLT